MNISKDRKLTIYGITSIVLGILAIGGYLFEKHFILACFSGNYNGEDLVSFSAILLIIAGILILKRYSKSKIFLKIFSLILLLDALIKVFFFLDEFPLILILGQILFGFIIMKVSLDQDLNFIRKT